MPPMDMDQLRTLSQQASERLEGAKPSEESAPATPVEVTPPESTPPATPAPETGDDGGDAAPIAAKAEKPKSVNPAMAAIGKSGTAAPVVPSLGAQAPAAPAPVVEYKPNFKYKVSKEEKEIPAELRSIITDEKSEKFVRDIMERADGIHHIKERHQQLYQTHQELHQAHTELNDGLADMGQLLSKKDFGTFFDALKVDKRDVAQWLLKEAEFEQLPPARQQEIVQARQESQRAELLGRQSQMSQQQYVEQAQRTRALELQVTVMTNPQLASFKQSFDTQFGRAGAFEFEVQKAGAMAYEYEGIDLTPDEAAQRVIAHYGKLLQHQQGSGQPTGGAPEQPTPPVQAATPAAAQRSAPKAPPVIPNIAGGSSSPTRTAPKSLADLKKLSAEASARLSQKNG